MRKREKGKSSRRHCSGTYGQFGSLAFCPAASSSWSALPVLFLSGCIVVNL